MVSCSEYKRVQNTGKADAKVFIVLVYLLETLISSEYGRTISGHVTVLRQWLLKKSTDYILNIFITCFSIYGVKYRYFIN